MKIISHRGNLFGPDPKIENSNDAILKCLSLGLDIEVDLWFKNQKFYLGHDEPKYELDHNFFLSEKIWFHLKNLEALEEIQKINVTNFFWHQNDKCTITSSGFYWLYPKNYINSEKAIFVLPELDSDNLRYSNYLCYGICTDFAISLKEKFNH